MKERVENVGIGFRHLANKFADRRKKFEVKLRSHHTLYAFLGGVGVVMFWHGLWEGLNQIYAAGGPFSFIGNPAVSMTVGVVILTFTGLFVLELVGREAQELEDKIEDVQEDIEDVQEDIEDVQDDLATAKAHEVHTE